ncbi:MAG: CAP domain-containing protein, partial [Planctomycetota bacterium]
MKNWLKKYFIPHRANDHKPHILRTGVALGILSLVLILEIIFLAESMVLFRQTDFFALILPNVLVDQTNESRLSNNLLPLKINSALEEAAKLKAQDMAQKGYFAHTSPDGKAPWHWLSETSYQFNAAGENLAINFSESKDVSEAWMKSTLHRDNILNQNFTEIGIATARGMYKGQEAIFVVQFFGRPASTNETAYQASPSQEIKVVFARETNIAGETTDLPQELFVSVEKDPDSPPLPINETLNLNAQANDANAGSQSSFMERVAVNPKTSTKFLFLVIATIISLALTLKIFV